MNWIRLHGMLSPSLLCESGYGLRDQERGSKQREIVEKTNTRRLRAYYLHTMSRVKACVKLYLTLMLLVFVLKKKFKVGEQATDFWNYCLEH